VKTTAERMRTRCSAFAIAAMLTTISATAQAQVQERGEANTETKPPQQSDGLRDIVVTAQKREQSLMEIPLAIQAVDSQALQNQGVTRIEELQNVVPGLAIQYGQGGTLSPFLRGVGNALSGNYAENSVATYVDDVPRPRMRGSNALPDVERVEVLKGPQGALYGRNATGGAINIVTRNPGPVPEARGSVSWTPAKTDGVSESIVIH
jgi:iron complex outermembrane recepter protein